MPEHNDQPDPVARRRRASAGHHDAVDKALAAKPKAPSNITTVRAIDNGIEVAIDDAAGTRVALTNAVTGRIAIGIEVDGRAIVADLNLGAARHVADALHALAGLDVVAPIVGTR